MRKIFILVVLIFLSFNPLFSQKEEVSKYLLMIAQGKTSQVRLGILELLAKYPDDPGVRLLHATIIENAYLAMDIYKDIVKDHPQSDWADDAQWRIVQFYSIVGDTLQANKELTLMRNNYPTSPFLGPANDVVRLALGIAKSEIRQTMDFNAKVNNISPKNENNKAELAKTENPKIENKASNTSIKESLDAKDKKNIDLDEKSKANKSNIETSQNNKKDNEISFYGLQVSIFNDKESAENEKNKFLAQRMRTQVVEKKVDNKIMYAVVIGHYSSMDSAEAAKIIVGQQCKCEPIIYKK